MRLCIRSAFNAEGLLKDTEQHLNYIHRSSQGFVSIMLVQQQLPTLIIACHGPRASMLGAVACRYCFLDFQEDKWFRFVGFRLLYNHSFSAERWEGTCLFSPAFLQN